MIRGRSHYFRDKSKGIFVPGVGEWKGDIGIIQGSEGSGATGFVIQMGQREVKRRSVSVEVSGRGHRSGIGRVDGAKPDLMFGAGRRKGCRKKRHKKLDLILGEYR